MFGIFLDRDGTLIADKHYLKSPDKVELLDGVVEAIGMLLELNCRLFLFSNQSGISRGLLTLADVDACNAKMLNMIGYGNIFSDVCIAPEGPNDPIRYRKPSPRFINEMIEKHHLQKSACFMVGDKFCDLLAGINAGITPVLVGSDHSDFEVNNLIKNMDYLRFSSLLKFAIFLKK